MASSSCCLLTPVTGLTKKQPNTALTTITASRFLAYSSSSTYHPVSLLNHHCSSAPYAWSGTLFAAPGPPSPSDSEPPTPQNPNSPSGFQMTLSKFKDTVQIFSAVLFWMGLFFWASACDVRNNGRPDKKSRFRR